jgi:hypothetical protein
MPSKKVLAGIGIVIIIVLILLAVFALPVVSESPPAVLVVESGTVEVAQSPYHVVTGQMNIKQGDSIKTGSDGKASVVLFGSSVVRLDSSTEINLAELSPEKDARKVSINQSSGRIWSKVIKLSGIDNYQINTPRSVATIRGTGFDSWIKLDGTVEVSVVEGAVNVVKTTDQSSVDVNTEQTVTIGDLPLAVRTLVRDAWINGNEQKDKDWLLALREKIKAKYWAYVELAKSQYKLTDEQVNQYLDGALSGQYTQAEIDAALKQLGVEIKI